MLRLRHPRVLGRRDAAAPAGSGQKRMGPWGIEGSLAEDLSVIVRQDTRGRPLPPVLRLPFIRPMGTRARSPGSGADVVINPEVADGALAFRLNIYLHLNRHGDGPSLPPGGSRRSPQGFRLR